MEINPINERKQSWDWGDGYRTSSRDALPKKPPIWTNLIPKFTSFSSKPGGICEQEKRGRRRGAAAPPQTRGEGDPEQEGEGSGPGGGGAEPREEKGVDRAGLSNQPREGWLGPDKCGAGPGGDAASPGQRQRGMSGGARPGAGHGSARSPPAMSGTPGTAPQPRAEPSRPRTSFLIQDILRDRPERGGSAGNAELGEERSGASATPGITPGGPQPPGAAGTPQGPGTGNGGAAGSGREREWLCLGRGWIGNGQGMVVLGTGNGSGIDQEWIRNRYAWDREWIRNV